MNTYIVILKGAFGTDKGTEHGRFEVKADTQQTAEMVARNILKDSVYSEDWEIK